MIERSTGSAATAASRTVDAAILLAFAIGYKLYHGAPILTNISNPLPVHIVLAKQLQSVFTSALYQKRNSRHVITQIRGSLYSINTTSNLSTLMQTFEKLTIC
jgi:hypothetical protein